MNILQRLRPSLVRAAALLLALGVVLLVERFAPQIPRGLEESVGDLTWRATASERAERRVVVVDIDEASLAQVGAWPWPRSTVAQLSRQLHEAGAAVQVFDIVFPEPREGDAALAAAWAEAPVVAGQIFSLDPTVNPAVGRVAGGVARTECPPFAPASHGFVGTAESLLATASSAGPTLGHLTPRVESDGVVRKVPALVCHQGRAYPALALAALWRAAQPRTAPAITDWDWTWSRAGGVLPLVPEARLDSRSLPGLAVPIDARGDIRVPYRYQRAALTSLSAADVLAGRADRQLLKGAVVLVGATAFGAGDRVATPQASVASGLEVHAQLLAGLLDRHVPFTPVAAPALQWLGGALVLAVLLLASRGRSPVKRLPVAGAAMAALVVLGASGALVGQDLWLPWAPVALFALLAAVTLSTAEHAITRAQRERLSAHLGAYLPVPVAQRLAQQEPSGQLQMARRDLSVLVADIRNFSAFAAQRPAEETAALLHAFYCIAVETVERHGGVVENVVGDSVLAAWNAYGDCPDHPQRALAAGRELLKATRTLLAGIRVPEGEGPLQPLALGVGVESGSVIVGSFGPSRRRAHAALGEAVSVATRLQLMTQELSIPLLIGPQLAARLKAGSTEPLGEYLLEGLGRAYEVHAPQAWEQLLPEAVGWADVPPTAEPPDPDDAPHTPEQGLAPQVPPRSGPQPLPSA